MSSDSSSACERGCTAGLRRGRIRPGLCAATPSPEPAGRVCSPHLPHLGQIVSRQGARPRRRGVLPWMRAEPKGRLDWLKERSDCGAASAGINAVWARALHLPVKWQPRRSVLQALLNLVSQVGATSNHQASRCTTGLLNRLQEAAPVFVACWLKNGTNNHETPRGTQHFTMCYPHAY